MGTQSRSFWVLQTGEPLHVDGGEPRPMRAMNAADALTAAGHRVVVWSSAFNHQRREHRARAFETHPVTPSLEYRLVPSPGYRRNVGPGRLLDHAFLAANLRRALTLASPPDACLVGYPPIETASVMVSWLNRHSVPSLLDIKDQWPQLFLDPLPAPLRPLGRVALHPYFWLAKRVIRDASGISAMSESYLSWAASFAGRRRGHTDRVIRLTSPPVSFSQRELEAARQWWSARGVRVDGRPRFCFVGSHTRSFDFDPIVEAARGLGKSHPEATLLICGDGERTEEWRQAAQDLENVGFPGWIDRAQMHVLGECCTAFLAPYVRTSGFEMNLPNKIADALEMGLPIVTPLGGEVGELIAQHEVGQRYGPDLTSLHDCLELLIRDVELRERQSRNARDLFSEEFAFGRVYGGLVSHLEDLAATGSRT